MPDTMAPGDTFHASCVSVDGRGVLILGDAGSGKSALALQLMAYGAVLVADDRTTLTARDGTLWATCPPTIRGVIEARGVGLLHATTMHKVAVDLIVDLNQPEDARLPDPCETTILGISVPLQRRVDTPAFAAAVLQRVRMGRFA
jgi:HPr kinase/phosphorylase